MESSVRREKTSQVVERRRRSLARVRVTGRCTSHSSRIGQYLGGGGEGGGGGGEGRRKKEEEAITNSGPRLGQPSQHGLCCHLTI